MVKTIDEYTEEQKGKARLNNLIEIAKKVLENSKITKTPGISNEFYINELMVNSSQNYIEVRRKEGYEDANKLATAYEIQLDGKDTWELRTIYPPSE